MFRAHHLFRQPKLLSEDCDSHCVSNTPGPLFISLTTIVSGQNVLATTDAHHFLRQPKKQADEIHDLSRLLLTHFRDPRHIPIPMSWPPSWGAHFLRGGPPDKGYGILLRRRAPYCEAKASV
jgi:hypothetical protein